MGLPCIAMKMPKFVTFAFLQNLVTVFTFLLIATITCLGLLKPQRHREEEEEEEEETSAYNYVLLMDGVCSAPIRVSIDVMTSLIKERLPVIEYGRNSIVIDEENRKKCRVCLERIKRSDEIRKLSNCDHVFHRECLDTWIDYGKITCPLCRSVLLPFKNKIGRIL